MKNLYHKNNKGKVHPSYGDESVLHFSVLNLLPTVILASTEVLSIQDLEVLAYLITRSMKTTSNSNHANKSKTTQQQQQQQQHKSGPVFECGCFDCYTSYWFRWDSSPNRELIHQVIEAFEEHLTNGELSNNKKNNNRKKDNMGRRGNDKLLLISREEEEMKSFASVVTVQELVMGIVPVPEGDDSIEAADVVDEEVDVRDVNGGKSEDEVSEELMMITETMVVEEEIVEQQQKQQKQKQRPGRLQRGLARKVLPDVLGLFNSRLWSLWSPNN